MTCLIPTIRVYTIYFKISFFNCNLIVQWKIESDQRPDYPDVKAELETSLFGREIIEAGYLHEIRGGKMVLLFWDRLFLSILSV